ncbi:DUF4651 domain-containing protein [Streptococcus dentapri]|uniref:DUF4651 domain-containing protein n=1 Tax=Streptococcus dentapri TaxID=573564 RepID=A0ABV8CZL1_9STRE
MKYRKILLASGLIGLAGLTALGYKLQNKIQDEKESRGIAELRDFFGQLGTIQVVYIKSYESASNQLIGGVVLEDGRVFDFIYDESGQITYQEKIHD